MLVITPNDVWKREYINFIYIHFLHNGYGNITSNMFKAAPGMSIFVAFTRRKIGDYTMMFLAKFPYNVFILDGNQIIGYPRILYYKFKKFIKFYPYYAEQLCDMKMTMKDVIDEMDGIMMMKEV